MHPFRWGALALALAALASPSARAGGDTLTLDEAKRLAVENSPHVRQAELDAGLVAAERSGARALVPSEPVLEGTMGKREDAEPGDDWSVALEQEIYLPGQRWVRAGAAGRRGDAAQARLRRARQVARADAELAFVDILAAEERSRLAAADDSLAAELVSAARARRAAGTAGELDENLALVERMRTSRDLLAAESEAAEAIGRLRSLLSLPPEAELVVSGSLHVSSSGQLALGALVERALQSREDLAAASLDVEAAKRERRAARLDVLPRLTIRAEMERDAGEEVAWIGVAMPIPLFRRNSSGRMAANATLRHAEAAQSAARSAASAEVASAAQAVRSAMRLASVFDAGAAEALERTDEMLASAYRGGKIDFAQLVVLRREVVEARQARVAALAEMQKARVRLSLATGTEEETR